MPLLVLARRGQPPMAAPIDSLLKAAYLAAPIDSLVKAC